MFGVFGKPVIRAYPSSRKSSKHNNGFRTDHQYSIKEQDGYDGDKKQEYRRRHQIVNRSRFRQLVSLKSKFYHGSMLRCAVCFGSLFFICVHMSHHISTKQQLTSGRECATKRLSHKSQNGIANDELMRLFSTKHPRTLQYDNLYSSQPERVLYIPIVKRSITDWTKEDQNRQKDLWNDEEYDPDYVQAFSGYEDQPQCKPMHEWQKLQFPTCNSVHEQALNDEEAWKFLANGWYRQTFEVNDPWSKDPFAMKTLRNIRDFYPNLLDRHRVDALIYERTTSSPWITDIYSYCSYSGLFEYANGGTLMDEILQKDSAPPLSRRKKLKYAIQAASGMADLHSIDSINGYAAMAHTDIMFDQWIWTGDRYKLNDFNRGHLLYWDETKRKSCQYRWNENNPGCFRSPEEYKGELQSEKIDVFSLGNVIYGIATGFFPFDEKEMEEAQELVINGELPPLTKELKHSNNPVDKALIKAMRMCFEYNFEDRAKASEVRDFLLRFDK